MLVLLLACAAPPIEAPDLVTIEISTGQKLTVRNVSAATRVVDPGEPVGRDVAIESWLLDDGIVDPGDSIDLGLDAYCAGDWPASGSYDRDLLIRSTDEDGEDPVEQVVPVRVIVP